ncbi:uncharacterized protein LOC133899118 [Phragmites australis]|uniref:uncharacterized protein LOC133899118 n=1 Tax=Phragmites australis TaxID=29695 RepID=UPI002D798A99|nr:uncharacterized protein LOC133899118 [Phragmites australis]
MPRKVPREAAAASTTQRTGKKSRLTSAVWVHFVYNASDSTATCRKCGATLCAGGKKGTSHLKRHTKTKRCKTRAAEQRRLLTAPAAAETSPGKQEHYSMSTKVADEEEEEFFFVDGINIPELFDELDAKGLVFIDQDSQAVGAGDAHFRPNLPQAANSSSRRFFETTKARQVRPPQFFLSSIVYACNI